MRLGSPRSFRSLLGLLAFFLAAITGHAQTVTIWTPPNSGAWDDPAQWSNGVPNAATFEARVDGGNTTESIVTVNGDFTVGRLVVSFIDSVRVANGKTLTLDPSAGFEGAGVIAGNGALTLGSNGALTRLFAAGDLTVNAPIEASTNQNAITGSPGATITLSNSVHAVAEIGMGGVNIVSTDTIRDDKVTVTIQPHSSFVQTSTGLLLLATLSGHTLSGSAAFTLDGNIRVSNIGSGNALTQLTKDAVATLTNFDSSTSTLNGGKYLVASGGMGSTGGPAVINLNVGPILVNNASITLSGPSSTFSGLEALQANPGTLSVATQPFTTAGAFDNTGTLLTSVTTFTATGAMTNSGVVNVRNSTSTHGGNGTLQLVAGYTQTAGNLQLSSTPGFPATVNSPNAPLDLNGGRLEGDGTINANVENDATIAPFTPLNQFGNLTINGSLTLGSASILSFVVGVTAQNSLVQDSLTVNGAVSLDGQLEVKLRNGETPAASDVFTLLTSNSALSNAFDNVPDGERLNTADGLGSFLVSYGSGENTNRVQISDFRTEAPPSAGQLLNIATRMRVQTGENVLIGGFIINETDAKKVLIRGIGPSLAQFFNGSLSNPTLELFQGQTLLASNDDWKESQQGEIEDTGIPPSHDLESAIVRTLDPGAYTAIVRGSGDASGIGVVEAYDLDQAANSKLANIATRGFVDTGDNVMIGGLIVGPAGGASAKVVVRAIGPTLGDFGIAGALQDPTLELVNSDGVILRSNDNWKESQQGEIEAVGLAPNDERESALVETVAPGNYTAIVRGSENTTGVGLVEAYNIE